MFKWCIEYVDKEYKRKRGIENEMRGIVYAIPVGKSSLGWERYYFYNPIVPLARKKIFD